MIKALVCIKSIPDLDQVVAGDWKYGSHLEEPDVGYANQIINNCDENAVEILLRLRDDCRSRSEEVVIEAVTIGGLKSAGVLKEAYAIGVDRCVQIESTLDNRCNFQAMAALLHAYIRKQDDYDIILCGESAPPYENGQTAFVLAHLLGYLCVSDIRELTWAEGRYQAVSQSDGVRCIVTPAGSFVGITGNISGFKLRLPTLKERLQSGRKKIIKMTAEDLGLSEETLRHGGGKTLKRFFAEEVRKECQHLELQTNPKDLKLLLTLLKNGCEKTI